MPGPFTFPVAEAIPFQQSSPAAGITAENVRDAIEEVKQDAINNDRYPFTAQSNGNTGVGKYLEVYAGITSDEAPFYFPESSQLKTITVGAVAASTGTIGIFKFPDLTNPILTISLTAETRKIFTFADLQYTFLSGDELAIKVTSGSFSKPHLRLWVNTIT